MPDIRKCKGLLGLALTLVLLSFFYSSPAFSDLGYGIIKEEKAVPGAGAEALQLHENEEAGVNLSGVRPATLTAGESGMPDHTARISLARTLLDELLARDHKIVRSLLARFLLITVIAIFMLQVASRMLIRRYGYHMIELWQNINYIHEVDGKKGERFSIYISSY